MKQLKINSYNELGYDIAYHYDVVNNLVKGTSVIIIAKFNEAQKIITQLLSLGYSIFSLNLCHPTDNGYEKEYVISINDDGLWCEPAWIEDSKLNRPGYLDLDGAVCYLMDNCNSKIIQSIYSKLVYEVSVAADDEVN